MVTIYCSDNGTGSRDVAVLAGRSRRVVRGRGSVATDHATGAVSATDAGRRCPRLFRPLSLNFAALGGHVIVNSVRAKLRSHFCGCNGLTTCFTRHTGNNITVVVANNVSPGHRN